MLRVWAYTSQQDEALEPQASPWLELATAVGEAGQEYPAGEEQWAALQVAPRAVASCLRQVATMDQFGAGPDEQNDGEQADHQRGLAAKV